MHKNYSSGVAVCYEWSGEKFNVGDVLQLDGSGKPFKPGSHCFYSAIEMPSNFRGAYKNEIKLKISLKE